MNMFTNSYDDQNFASRLSDGAFLMIGLGGEGIRALKALKLQMLNFADRDAMEDRVRFLAVDTDDLELGDQRILKPEEYLILNAEDEDAVGTGSRREIRKAYICRDDNYLKLKDMLSDDILQMDSENSEQDLHCFLLSGITGGTGSGLIVDLGIILKNVIEKGSWNFGKVVTGAFLMMPYLPMGGTADVQMNANAYATLKELDFLNRSAEDRIFDSTALLEHRLSDGSIISPETTEEVLGRTILSLIAVNDLQSSDGLQLPDAALQNGAAVQAAVSADPEAFPQKAGYTCFTMGYKEIPISRKEVELYILKILYKRFEEMNQKNEAALHASNALRERFEQFLRVCELDEESMKKKESSSQGMSELINGEIDKMIRNPEEGLSYAKSFCTGVTKQGGLLESLIVKYKTKVLFKSKNEALAMIYEGLKSRLVSIAESIDIVERVLERKLRPAIEEGASMPLGEEDLAFSSPLYYFRDGEDSPENQVLNRFVKEVLMGDIDSLVTEFAGVLWEENLEMKIWVCAPKGMENIRPEYYIDLFSKKLYRDRVEKNLCRLVVALCSGDPEARVFDASGAVTEETRKTAEIILDRVAGRTLYFADYVNPARYSSIAPLRYLLVPSGRYAEDWNGLSSALEAQAAKAGLSVSVIGSALDDRIALTALNHGVAPFMLQSVREAEIAYDSISAHESLHGESVTGESWADLPKITY